MTNTTFKRLRIFNNVSVIILLVFSMVLPFALNSCMGPPSLSIGEIVISMEVEEGSNEPLKATNDFNIDSKQIYATIKYKGAIGKDTWGFKWSNVTTGETVLDTSQKFSDEKPELYFQGTVASNIFTTDTVKIIPPGQYRVEFYYNEKLEKTADFTVSNPQIHILEITLAKSIDEKGAPTELADEFYPNDTVYACVKMDYLIEGNSLKAVWKNESDVSINESTVDLTENYYEPYYVWFSLALPEGGRPVEPGKYKVEIFLNDVSSEILRFEILKTAPITFEKGTFYSNKDFNFTIQLPDNWTYSEEAIDDYSTVYLNTPDNSPIFFAFSERPSKPIKPYEEMSKTYVEEIAGRNSWTFIDTRSRNYLLKNGLDTLEISYLFKDSSDSEFIVSYSFTEYEDSVFIFYVIVNNETYGEIAQEIFYGMLDTLAIKTPEEAAD